jgi:hypothetical protein
VSTPATVYRCRCHDQPYTVCPACGCQYCPQYWRQGCPRDSWHPAHGTTAQDVGERYQVLQAARQRAGGDQ